MSGMEALERSNDLPQAAGRVQSKESRRLKRASGRGDEFMSEREEVRRCESAKVGRCRSAERSVRMRWFFGFVLSRLHTFAPSHLFSIQSFRRVVAVWSRERRGAGRLARTRR